MSVPGRARRPGRWSAMTDKPEVGHRQAAAPDTKDHVLESVEEHHVVLWMLSELKGLDATDERFDAKMTVLMENVRHHVEEEEQEWFPDVRKTMGRTGSPNWANRWNRPRRRLRASPSPFPAPNGRPYRHLKEPGGSIRDSAEGAAAASWIEGRRAGGASTRPSPTTSALMGSPANAHHSSWRRTAWSRSH